MTQPSVDLCDIWILSAFFSNKSQSYTQNLLGLLLATLNDAIPKLSTVVSSNMSLNIFFANSLMVIGNVGSIGFIHCF